MQQRRRGTILILVGLILGATMIGVGLAGLVWSVSGAIWLVVIGAPLTLIALYRSYVSRRRDESTGAR